MAEMIQPARYGRRIKVDGSKLTAKELKDLITVAKMLGGRIVPIKEDSK